MVDIFLNMDSMFETYRVYLEIYIEDKLVQKQRIEAPKEMLMMNFIQTAEQISNDARPIKIKMIRPEVVWDNFENKEKTFNNEIEFSNNVMVAWEKDREYERSCKNER